MTPFPKRTLEWMQKGEAFLQLFNKSKLRNGTKMFLEPNFSLFIVKLGFSAPLTPYITQLCCLSFDYKIFPNCLKIAKVIPVFKNGSRSEVTNYRPIILAVQFFKNS